MTEIKVGIVVVQLVLFSVQLAGGWKAVMRDDLSMEWTIFLVAPIVILAVVCNIL
jgi:hypothetical protein